MTTVRFSELDDIDFMLIRALQGNGRISNVELADECGLSPSSTLERVRRLERSGVIEGYTARVDPRALGHQVIVFVQVTMREHDQKAITRFEKAVAELPEVLECHHVAGEFDFLLKALIRDVAALRTMLVERLSGLPGVGRIHTTLVLSTSKHTLDVPINEK
jgi:Lrp/AsnC family transcriptional regulator, leucine-responsive regulatory protein